MEPEQLRRGKEFHKKVQSGWDKSVKDGELNIEQTINLLPRSSKSKHIKRGRIDMFVDEKSDFVSVAEIKATDWDKVKSDNICKLLGAHRRQVMKYVIKYLDEDKINVCAGIIYPKAPKSNELKEYIEEYLIDYGLQVVWYFD